MHVPQIWTVSNFTLLNSLVRLKEYVQTAKKFGYQNIGIMDENVLSGAIEFQTLAKEAGLTALFGMTITYFDDEEQNFSLNLLAKNYAGYVELMRLSSLKKTNQDQKLKLAEFLPFADSIALIFTTQSECFFKKDHPNFNFFDWLKLFDSISEKFMGVSPSDYITWQKYVKKVPLPTFYLNEVRYLDKHDYPAYKIANAISTNSQLSLSQIPEIGSKFLWRANEIYQKIVEKNLLEALENTNKLVGKINFIIPTKQNLLPKYPLENGKTAADFLQELAFSNLAKRVKKITPEYTRRLDMELSIINKMGFDDYFLIVWDLLDYAQQEGIFTGAGRGSAAGSLVAYVLKITDVDPISYHLLFERFLNSQRLTMPDIDIDIPDNKREKILQYVAQKYGRRHVAQIATFGTLGAKQSLRDVGRVLGFSPSEMSRLSKTIPNKLNITLADAYTEAKKFRELVNATPRNKALFSMAKKFEGAPRHVSTHAAGVVISDQDLFELIPLQIGSNNIFLTQFTMYDIEKIGLLKMDFLGLRNLSIIADALYIIKKVWNIDLKIKKIDLQDIQTLRLFNEGKTKGIFQFESPGIIQVLRQLKPDSIEDIVATTALYRPGPMENIPQFIARKNGQEQISYSNESLAPILKNTYGIIVYQEQIMRILQEMAGFTLGQADIVRRAISKKNKKAIAEKWQHFLAGAQKKGYSETTSKNVYQYIEKFANYGFNRSHAFAYSVIAFEMAYLKAHFTGAFYVALLHSVRGNLKKNQEYVQDARNFGIKFLPPDINNSEYSFHLLKNKNQIRFGFSAIKDVRRDFAKEIITERQKKGAFSSVNDFLLRINKKWLKEDWLKPLVLTGTFDNLDKNRQKLMTNLSSKIQNIVYSGGNLDLLSSVLELKEKKNVEYSLNKLLENEEKYLGTYLSAHPLEKYEQINKTTISEAANGKQVKLIVILRDIRTIRTKKGETMAFLQVSDLTGEISVTIFPKLYSNVFKKLQIGKELLIEGTTELSTYDNALQAVAQKIINLKTNQFTIFLKIDSKNNNKLLTKLKKILSKNPGINKIVLYFADDKKQVQLPDKYNIALSTDFFNNIFDLLGKKNVLIR